MSMYPNSRPIGLDYAKDDKAIFNFFNAVYAWMAVGLAVTAAVAYFVSQSPTILHMVYYGRGTVVMMVLGATLVAMAVRKAAATISVAAATTLFILYAVIVGAMISGIFLIYPMSTIAGAFVMTAGTFGIMSVYGFVTKRDLTKIGSICLTIFVGLFLASIVNVFWANNALSWVVTYGVLIVFIIITAYRTQQLKNLAYEHQGDANLAARWAIVGSLMLYISFINMFLSILRIMGNRR